MVRATRYLLGEQLGRGGMGTIYRAHDRELDRTVAYKRLRVDQESSRSSMTALFRREYETMLSLEHPGTVQAFDFGYDDEGPFYTMELLSGADLSRAAPLPWPAACSMLRDVASALALLHARRFVHRDVGPNNVRLLDDGSAKLLDYGALAPFGPPRDVVGTPAFMSPECARGLALDGRADLFSLGSLAYWSLTRRPSVAAKSFDDLEQAWASEPRAPSSFVEGIPGELDELILDLLKRDREARPQTAADVIERLTAIARLPPERSADVIARSFLARPPLSEREAALARLQHALASAREGRGGVLLLEANAGLGRSALLEQLATEAQLAGVLILRSKGTHTVPLSSLRELLQRSEEAFDARPGATAGASSAAEVAELRARTVMELQSELLARSKLQPTLITVDDAQLADADSLRVLSALIDSLPTSPMLLVLSVEVGAAMDPEVRAKLEQRAERVTLEPLTASGVAQLAASVLGNVPNARRAASELFEASGGSPALAMDLLRTLLHRGDIAYAGGTFTVPQTLDLGRLSRQGIRLSRLADLDASAQHLAGVLALSAEPLTRAQVQDATESSLRDVTLILGTLARRGLASAAQPDAYTLSSPVIRAQLEEQLDGKTRSTLHAKIARALLAANPSEARTRIAAGMHIIRSGTDVLEGANIIAETCDRARYEVAALSSLVPSLEAALAIYDQHRRSDTEALRLLIPLSLSGYYGDLTAQNRHLERTLRVLSRSVGLAWVPRLSRWFGRRLSLYLALLLGALLGVFLRARSKRSFRDNLQALFGIVASSVVAHVSAFDILAALRVAAWLEPFAVLPAYTGPGLAREFAWLAIEVARHRPSEAERRFRAIDSAFVRGIRGVDARVLALFAHGALNGRAQLAAMRSDPRTVELAQALHASGTFFAHHAQIALVGYHGLRGEEDLAEAHRVRAEELAMRGGLSWAANSVLCFWLAQSHAATGNAVGLLHVIAALEPMQETSPGLRVLHGLAIANLARIRGQYAAAEKSYQTILSTEPAKLLPSYGIERAYQAECLLRLERPADAQRLCIETLAELDDEDAHSARRRGLEQQLAATYAAAGDCQAARASLRSWLVVEAELQNPLTLGSLHHDLAWVEMTAGDPRAFLEHAKLAEHHYRKTGHPLLLARCDRLHARAGRAGLMEPIASTPMDSGADDLGDTYVEQPTRDVDLGGSPEATASSAEPATRPLSPGARASRLPG